MTQRKKPCILHSNRLLTYRQAREGVIHYESCRRQMSVGSGCDARHDCDISGCFDKHGGAVRTDHCGRRHGDKRLCFAIQNYGGVYPAVSTGIAASNTVSSSVVLYDALGSYGIAIGLLLAMVASVTLLIPRMYCGDEHGVLSKQYWRVVTYGT